MKKKLLKLNVELKFDIATNKIYVDGNPTSKSYILACSWFSSLKESGKSEDETFKELKKILMSDFSFNSKEEKQKLLEAKRKAKQEKEEEKLKKEQEKKERTCLLENAGYVLDENGRIQDLMHNYAVSLKDDACPYYEKLAYNEFNHYIYVEEDRLQDIDYAKMRDYINCFLHFDSENRLKDAIRLVAEDKKYHPIKEFLESREWDGKERLDTFFIKFLGAEDTPLNRALTKKWVVGMIKRIYEPGSPNPNILIVIDPTQGTGKTTVFERFANVMRTNPNDSTLLLKIDRNIEKSSKDTYIYIKDSVIGLFDELAAINKSDPDFVKSFVSQNEAKIRLPFGREPENIKYSIVWAATTNQMTFLKDFSAELSDDNVQRRMWTMLCHGEVHDKIWWDKNLPDEYLRQVLFEAYHIYMTEEDFDPICLSPEERDMLREAQLAHKTQNDDNAFELTKSILERYYAEPLDYKSQVHDFTRNVRDTDSAQYVGMTHIYKISSIYPAQLSTILKSCYHENRSVSACGAFLRTLGWQSEKKKVNGSYRSVYYRAKDTAIFDELTNDETKIDATDEQD